MVGFNEWFVAHNTPKGSYKALVLAEQARNHPEQRELAIQELESARESVHYDPLYGFLSMEVSAIGGSIAVPCLVATGHYSASGIAATLTLLGGFLAYRHLASRLDLSSRLFESQTNLTTPKQLELALETP